MPLSGKYRIISESMKIKKHAGWVPATGIISTDVNIDLFRLLYLCIYVLQDYNLCTREPEHIKTWKMSPTLSLVGRGQQLLEPPKM